MSRVVLVLLLLLLLLTLATGCDLPRDTAGTLKQLDGGILRAGMVRPDPRGKALLEEFATRGGGAYEEVVASPEVLLKALEVGEIQAVYGQIVEGSVLSKQAPMSRPYHTLYPNFSRQTPSGEEALEAGGVKPGEGMDALWLRVHSPYRVDAGSPYEIELSELEPTGRKPDLPEQRLVFLVRPGEHRFLLELDKFLLSGSSGSNE